jgi:hypothetical protein
MQEDIIDMFLPWTDKNKVAQYHKKESEYIHVIQSKNERNEEFIKDKVHTEPPCWHRGRPRVQCFNNAPTKP